METVSQQSLVIDLRKRASVAIPYFIQGDTNILTFVIKENGEDADLTNVERVLVNYKRSDNYVVTRELTVTGSSVEYTIGQDEMKTAGIGEIELKFYDDTNSQRLSTVRMKVNIIREIGVGLEGEDGPTLVQQLLVNGEYAETQGDYAKSAGDTALTNWLSPVTDYASVEAIVEPQLGDTVQTNDNGYVYRFDGTQWINTQQYGATALADVNAQLADTVKKDDTGILDLNIFDEPTRSAIQGIEPGTINAVLGTGNVKTTNLADASVNLQKTDFATLGKNLFNKNGAISGRLDTTTGQVATDSLWVTSDFFPIQKNTEYKRSHLASVVVYDQDKNILTAYSPNTIAFTTGITVAYARTSVQVTNKNVYQLEKGAVSTTYEDYKVTYKGLNVPKENLSTTLQTEINNLSTKTEVTSKLSNTEKTTSPYAQNYELKISQLLNESDPTEIFTGSLTQDFAMRWRNKSYGWRITTTAAAIPVFRSIFTTPKTIPTVAAIGLWVYVEDVTKVTNITLGIGTEQGVTTPRWSRDITSLHYPLKNGWNLLRWAATSGDITFWGEFHLVRVAVTTNAATSVVIGSIYTESPPKAQILFIEDGGYIEYLNLGYPTLKQRGIPTTWALNPGRLGVGRVITESQVDTLGLDPESEFSFHSWKSDVVANMTPEEIRADTIKSVRWIQKKGLQPKHMWRAAFTQNLATNHAAIQDLVEAYATYHGASGMNVFPFINPFNVGRRSIHGETVEGMNNVFATLQKTHGLYVCYTHGIDTGNPEDASSAQWSQFLQLIDEGIAGGWLEGVTYDMLRKRHERQFGGYGFKNLIDAT
jgi:hypothetical protein